MTRTAVLPIAGQSDPMFTLIDPNGNDLHAHLMELNKIHADDQVRKNTGEALVSELERIRDNIEEVQGVSRRDVEEIEAAQGVAIEAMPIGMFTVRRSSTGLSVALEEISVAKAGLIAGGIVAAIGVLLKIISWFTNRASSGAGGAGSGAVAKKNAKVKEEVKAAEDIIADNGGDVIKEAPQGEAKKSVQDMLADYLDSRNLFIDACIAQSGTSYTNAFSALVPTFVKKLDEGVTILERTAEVAEYIKDRIADNDAKTSADIARRVEDIIADIPTVIHWPEAAVFVKATGGRYNPADSVAANLKATLARFADERNKPSKIKPAQLGPESTMAGLGKEFNACTAALNKMESTGSPDGYFLQIEEYKKQIDRMEKAGDKLNNVLGVLKDKIAKKQFSHDLEVFNDVSKLLRSTLKVIELFGVPNLINENIGKAIETVTSKTTDLTSKLNKINIA